MPSSSTNSASGLLRRPNLSAVERVVGRGRCLLGLWAITGFLLSFTASPVTGAADTGTSYSLRVWGQDTGLPQNHITAITQTDDGYLWLGTFDGLARFDGARFVVYDSINTPALRDGRIVSLCRARDGGLWIGHETGHVTLLKQGRFISARSAPDRGAESVVGLCEDADGRVWTVDQHGTVQRADVAGHGATSAKISPDYVSSAVDPYGTVWVTRNGQLSRLEGDTLQPTSVASGWTTATVYGLGASRQGGIWISNEGQLQRWQQGRCIENWGAAPWGTRILTAMVELRNGSIAIGTLDQGLYIWERGRPPQLFDVQSGLPHNSVRAIFEDTEGNLWVGTGGGGLVMLRAAAFVELHPPTGWQGRSVLAVCPSRMGGLWVGTEGAGLFRFADGQWKHYGETDGLTNLFVWSIAESAAGELYVGTWGGGVFRRGADDRFRVDTRFDPAIPVPAMMPSDKSDMFWFGTGTGLIGLREGDVKKTGAEPGQTGIHLGANAGLASPDVRAVADDANGTVWFGMLGGGLAAYQPDGTTRQYHAKDGLSSELILCLLPDRDGSLWIGTSGGGINRFKDGRFSVVNSNHGLPSNIIGHLLDDGAGYLWISSHSGIIRVEKAELQRCADGQVNAVKSRLFGRGDGLPTLETAGGLNAACRTPDGRLWFCTAKGLVNVDPKTLPVNPRPPHLVVEDLLVGGISHGADGESIRVEAGAQRIQIRYTALSLAAPEKVRFKHRLIGLDDRWTEATQERTTDYNVLPPGPYQFEVVACNNDGVWATEPAVQKFVVQPFYWQTWWFRVGMGALVIGGASLAGIGGARARMRRQLEKAEHEQAVEHERARIARDIHDDLGVSLTRITLLTQTVLTEADSARDIAPELTQIYGTARELTRSMDEIVWAVNPRHDSLDSLANFLAKFAQDLLRAARVRCRLDFPISLPQAPLTAEVRHNVFLACKEVLNNIVKHAGASEVRIALAVTPEGFRLVIEDNGRGFLTNAPSPASRAVESDRAASGNGLPNLAQRLADIGAVCEIKSEPGQGTRTTFSVALASTSH